ncbi:hydantoinase B/oxoprolinase family protein [Saliphagus sp. GCM10025317]
MCAAGSKPGDRRTGRTRHPVARRHDGRLDDRRNRAHRRSRLLQEGDVLVQNDPYSGNNHLPDFLLAAPVFVDDLLIGFSAVRGHWVDVGGTAPTSYAIDAGHIIKEGLRVPPGKLYAAGERNDALYETILANVRGRDERAGDMNAQLAGVRRGRKRLTEIAETHGVEATIAAMDQILANEESRMRSRIADLPDGKYAAEDYMDGDGVTDRQLPIRATLTVESDELTVDFAGTADRVEGGINTSMSCTKTATYYAFKVTLDPGAPGTTGAFRPIDVVAPSGCLVDAKYPAPVVAGNHETTYRIYDVVVRAIAEIDPELAFGAGEGSTNVLNYQAVDDESLNYTVMAGGMGALPDRDGIDAIRNGVGNTGLQPIERIEQDYEYVTVESLTIAEDTGGPGRYRGGCAARRVLRFDRETEIILAAERDTTQPYGLDGGRPGAAAEYRHVDVDGVERLIPSKTTLTVRPGEKIVIQPAGGGGFGDPTERDADAVLADVLDGYVDADTAREAYGVVVDPDAKTVEAIAAEHEDAETPDGRRETAGSSGDE